MKTGKRTKTNILTRFTFIDKIGNYVLAEHNDLGQELVICVNFKKGIYCETFESLKYTICNDDEFEWYKIKK